MAETEYKISIDRVMSVYGDFAGEEEARKSSAFCRSAVLSLEAMLDKTKPLAKNDYQICYAAACLAYYRYTLFNADTTESVRAGDVTVRSQMNVIVINAEKLLKDALSSIAPLLRSKGFAFAGV